MYKSRQAIKKWLDSMGIKNYKITKNLTIDVNDVVNISERGLTSIPVQFNHVEHSFYCYGNKLTSLEGSPKTVGGAFHCYENQLINLDYSPKKIQSDFDCSHNKITSLKNGPVNVGLEYDCSHNLLTSLEFVPSHLGERLIASHNKLTKLDHLPGTNNIDFQNNLISEISLAQLEKFFIEGEYLLFDKSVFDELITEDNYKLLFIEYEKKKLSKQINTPDLKKDNNKKTKI